MEFLSSTFSPLLNLPHDPVFKYIFIAINVISIICWVLSLITQNFSQIDKIWSIEPMLFAWVFLFTSIYFNGASTPNNPIIKSNESSQLRLIIMWLFVTLWGTRLTYNFWRKGGYEWKNEDYRWHYVRKMFDYPNKTFLFHIFNIVFISFFQNYLLLGLVMPMWFIQTNATNKLLKHQEPFNVLDIIVTVVLFSLFLIEIIADQQQWKFQTNKYKWIELSKQNKKTNFTQEEIESFKRGFLTNGLFKYSRHPNFFAEISMWWAFYAFTISSQYSTLVNNFSYSILLNYSVWATLSLTLLFQGSTVLTENISSSKYPEYAKYKARVSRFIPFFTTYQPKEHKKN